MSRSGQGRRIVSLSLCLLTVVVMVLGLQPAASAGLPGSALTLPSLPDPSGGPGGINPDITIDPDILVGPGISIDPHIPVGPGLLTTSTAAPTTTAPPAPTTTAPPTTILAPTTTGAPTTTEAPTITEMVATTVAGGADGGGLGGGWIAFIVVVAAIVLAGAGTMLYLLGKRSKAAPAGPQPGAQQGFCSQCGTPLAPGTKFCAKCGKAL